VHVRQIDALGRLTAVTEDPSGLNYLTSYTNDPLDNLVSVSQNGSRMRVFSFDSLSRLTSSMNPESGTLTYIYDANGNVSSRKVRAILLHGSGHCLERTGWSTRNCVGSA
jgi:YD repeat-containing protein